MPRLGSSVAIIGCGLGVLHARMAVLRACAPVIVIGDNKKRLQHRQTDGRGLHHRYQRGGSTRWRKSSKLTGGRGADYADRSGRVRPRPMSRHSPCCASGGTLSAFGITGEQDTMKIRPFEFVLGEKKITGSCAGVGRRLAGCDDPASPTAGSTRSRCSR